MGIAGSGKSTIANELLSTDVHSSHIATSDSAMGVTAECTVHTSDSYIVTDTVGLGEADIGTTPHDEAMKKLASFVLAVGSRYDHICFVKKAGRFTEEDDVYWRCFKELFKGFESHFVIILTSAQSTNADKENLRHVRDVVGMPKVDIVCVDFRPGDADDEDEDRVAEKKRKQSKSTLISSLADIRSRNRDRQVQPTPPYDISTRLYDILRTYATETSSRGLGQPMQHGLIASGQRGQHHPISHHPTIDDYETLLSQIEVTLNSASSNASSFNPTSWMPMSKPKPSDTLAAVRNHIASFNQYYMRPRRQ